jgi:hypothetical protein
MLVILNGVETIHKKFLARKIVAALNTFVVDGYTVDFAIEPFKVTSPTGEIVYCMAHGDQPATNKLLIDLDNDGVIDPEGNATFAKIIELQDKLFLEGGKTNHFYSVFIDLLYDFGITDTLNFPNSGGPTLRHPHGYDDVLENYNNRLGTTHVITGIFSKGFINKIKNDIGSENVIALNIIRNPSTCALLHRKTPDFYEDPGKELTLEEDLKKFKQSIINAAILSQLSDVITIKFEDIITAGKFTINNIDIPLPAGYDKHNEWLTVWENENVIPLNLVSSEELDSYNTLFQHYLSNEKTKATDMLEYINLLRTTPINEEQLLALGDIKMPEDIFVLLGYTPLTREDISE